MILRRMLATFALLVACSCGARTAETRNTNAVICAWIAGPDGFDPFATIGSAATMAEDLIYTPLIDIGPNLLPSWRTSLAYRVDVSDGGTRYVLHLRHGVRWSDGTPLTAKDVAFTIRLGTNPGLLHGVSADFALMRSVLAIGRHTVEVRLARPSPPFLVNALGEIKPLPERLLGRYPPDTQREAAFVNTDTAFSQHPVVSGPWRIVRNVPDAYLILAPNPSYWGPKPYIQEMVFRVYPEQDSLFAAVAAGEVDVTDIPPNLWRVRDRLPGNHRFISWPWNVTFILLPNYRDPAISWIRDPRIKRAMMYAIDRSFIVTHIMSGQADVLNGPIPTFSPYYDKALPRYSYDPQKARALLDAAGWRMHGDGRMKDGRVLRITLKTGGATDAVANDVAELIQANFKAVGVDCRLENEELQTFFSDVNASRFQLALRGNILSPYPDDYKWYDSAQTRANGGYNFGFYRNARVDAAIESARTAPSLPASRTDLDRYQQLAARDLPALYLFSNRLGAVVPSHLTGYELDPDAPAALPMGLQFWKLTRPRG